MARIAQRSRLKKEKIEQTTKEMSILAVKQMRLQNHIQVLEDDLQILYPGVSCVVFLVFVPRDTVLVLSCSWPSALKLLRVKSLRAEGQEQKSTSIVRHKQDTLPRSSPAYQYPFRPPTLVALW